MNNISPINAGINRFLNGIASVTSYAVDKSGTLVAPSVLGYLGGWFAGVGSHIGAFQGLTSGLYHVCVIRPAANYINANIGTTPDNISYKTANVFRTVGVVSEVAVPIILTSYYSKQVTENLFSCLDEDGLVKWFLTSPENHQYTWYMAMGVSVLPIAMQHLISHWRSENEANKRK